MVDDNVDQRPNGYIQLIQRNVVVEQKNRITPSLLEDANQTEVFQ